MIILTVTLALMLFGLVCRFGWTSLERLATLRLRGGAQAFLACAAQVVSVVTQQHRLALLLVSAALLASFYWLNRRQAGISLAMLGIVLNLAVMGANNGSMPVSSATMMRKNSLEFAAGTDLPHTKNTVLEDHEARLPWLSDRLLLPGPLARLAAWSIGDFLLLAGVGRMLWHTMKEQDNHDRHSLRGNATLS